MIPVMRVAFATCHTPPALRVFLLHGCLQEQLDQPFRRSPKRPPLSLVKTTPSGHRHLRFTEARRRGGRTSDVLVARELNRILLGRDLHPLVVCTLVAHRIGAMNASSSCAGGLHL